MKISDISEATLPATLQGLGQLNTISAIKRGSTNASEVKRVQKTLNAFGYGLDVDVDRANRCRRCGDFWRTHGCLPTEAICRAWYSCVDRITPGMILEAKAAGRPRRKRSA